MRGAESVSHAVIRTSLTLCTTPPLLLYWTSPPWTLDFSESPTDPPGGGGWTLDFLRSPTDPLGGGGWTLDFSEGQIDPQMRGNHIKIACKSLENTHFSPTRCAFGGSLGTFRGGWNLYFSESPTDPPGGGGWTLDFSESPTDPLGGGGWTLDF